MVSSKLFGGDEVLPVLAVVVDVRERIPTLKIKVKDDGRSIEIKYREDGVNTTRKVEFEVIRSVSGAEEVMAEMMAEGVIEGVGELYREHGGVNDGFWKELVSITCSELRARLVETSEISAASM